MIEIKRELLEEVAMALQKHVYVEVNGFQTPDDEVVLALQKILWILDPKTVTK